MIERGLTPTLPHDELAALGFGLILYPLTGLYAAARALESVYAQMRADGRTTACEDQLLTFERFNDLIGAGERQALAERYARK